MATHSSIVAWRIPWTEEPGGLQSIGLQGVRHDLATKTTTECHRRRISKCKDWGLNGFGLFQGERRELGMVGESLWHGEKTGK